MVRCSALRIITGVAASLLLVASSFARGNVQEIYERARLLDETNQNLREAIRLYTQVAAEAGDQRALAARAQFRVGVLSERLGLKDDARRAFQAVLSQYPDQTPLAQKARAKIGEADTSRRLVKRTGPSADGAYVETFTVSGVANLLPAIDPAGHRLYVMTSKTSENGTRAHEPSSLIVIDTQANSVIRTMPMEVYIDHMAFNAANSKLYATAQTNGHVKLIDAEGVAQKDIAIPGHPTGLAVNPVTNKVYVTSQGFGGNDKLFVIDGNTDAVTGPYDLKGVGGEIYVNSATNRVYAFAPPRTRVFDGADLSLVTDLNGLGVIYADSILNRIYAQLAEGSDESIQILDGHTHNKVTSLSAGWPVPSPAVDYKVGRLYLVLAQKAQLTVIDTATHTEVGRFQLAAGPRNVVVDPTTGNVYVCHRSNASIIGVFPGRSMEGEVPQEFADEFDSPALDPAWIATPGQGSYSTKDNPNYLRLRAGKRMGSNARLLMTRRFRGDHWTLEVKASYFTGTSGGSRTLSFGVHLGVGPMESVVRGSANSTTGNLVQVSRTREDWNGCCRGELKQFFWERGSVAASSLLPWTPGEAYSWRIRRDGRMVTIERSTDEINYTLLGAHTFGSQIDGVIQCFVIAAESFGESGAYADYDYVRLRRNDTSH